MRAYGRYGKERSIETDRFLRILSMDRDEERSRQNKLARTLSIKSKEGMYTVHLTGNERRMRWHMYLVQIQQGLH